MYRNCASRSGCCSPSRTLALPCRLNPLSRSSRPTVGADTRCPCPAQLTSQMPQRLGRPPQRRLRVASLIRLHQRQQCRDQVTVQLRGALASPAAAPHPPLGERRLTGLQLEHARADRRLADPRDLGHGPDPAVPQQPGLSSQQQPPLTLVQMRQQHLEPHRQLIADSGRNAHTTTSNHQSGGDTLFLYGFTGPGTSWPRSRPGCRPRSRTPTGRSSTPKTSRPRPARQLVELIDARISEMAARYSATYPSAMKCLTTDGEGLTAYLRLPVSTTTASGTPTSSSAPSARPAAAPRSSAGSPARPAASPWSGPSWTGPPAAGAAWP